MSSARYKRDIHDMGAASARLMNLRPVTFRYKDDPTGTIQYGLVAEEVARVYPELVTYGAGGKIESVRYTMLTGMLLNEMQKQSGENSRQSAQIARLKADRGREREQQAAFETRFLAQMAEVKAAFVGRLAALEQAARTPNGGHKLAAAFDR